LVCNAFGDIFTATLTLTLQSNQFTFVHNCTKLLIVNVKFTQAVRMISSNSITVTTQIWSGYISIRPDFRHRISESGIQQKINIRPSLDSTAAKFLWTS